MSNPLLYIPVEVMEPPAGSHIIGFVRGLGTVYGKYLATPFPQVVSNETQKIHLIAGWFKQMKENYCLFIKAEGANHDNFIFQVWTSQKHQPSDILYFVNYGIKSMWVTEESVQIKKHEFVSKVRWYSQEDYHYDIAAIPKGEIIQCEENHDLEAPTR